MSAVIYIPCSTGFTRSTNIIDDRKYTLEIE